MNSLIFNVDIEREKDSNLSETTINKIVEYSQGTVQKGDLQIDVFADGEIEPIFKQSVRKKKVFLFTSTSNPQNILSMNLAAYAAKMANCDEVIAIIPYFGYGRQDKKSGIRGSIGAKVMANMLESNGVNRLIAIDLHSDQLEGFFNIPVDHIQGFNIFKNEILELIKNDSENWVLASPDAGGVKRVDTFYKRFSKTMPELGFVFMSKTRNKPNEISKMLLIGDVKNKNVVLIDDMIDTGGTLIKAAEIMKQEGAGKIIAVGTHPLFSGEDTIKKFDDCVIDKIYVSDSLSNILMHACNNKKTDKIITAGISRSIAQVIIAMNYGVSASQLSEN